VVENRITKHKYFFSTAVFAATGIAAFILFFVVISPFFSKAQELTDEAKAKQDELSYLEDKKVKLEALKSREEDLKKDAELVRNALPEQKDVGRLFIQLDNMAKTSGGNLNAVTESSGALAAATTTDTVGSPSVGIQKITYTLPIDFKDYFGFKDFINKAESALRILAVEDFSLNASGTGGVSATINAATYVRSE